MTIRQLFANAFFLAIAAAVVWVATGEPAMAAEEPSYTVDITDGAFEVRRYPAMVAAEVRVAGDRDQASSAGFRLLAGYIFGGNTKKQSIAMTAPVTQSAEKGQESEKIAMTAPVLQTGQPGSWTVRFLMPAGYTLDTLPTPDDARVRLVEIPAARLAVVRFSGLARQDDIQGHTALLTAFVNDRGLQASGSPSLARYNPPWTPWFMRRNEIMVAVQP